MFNIEDNATHLNLMTCLQILLLQLSKWGKNLLLLVLHVRK